MDQRKLRRLQETLGDVEMAEEERFELSDGFPSAVFKTAAFDRSAISPWGAIMEESQQLVYP